MPKNPWYVTLVRHSAWTVARNPQFQFAVETQHLHDQKSINRAVKAGALLFSPAATGRVDVELMVNYPPGVEGLIPRARGSFHRNDLYVPGDAERDEIDKALVAAGLDVTLKP